MTIVMVVTLVVVVLALVIGARRNRARVTHIDRTIEHKDRDDA